LWAKGLNANEIHSEMRPVHGDKCFERSDEENAGGQKLASDIEMR